MKVKLRIKTFEEFGNKRPRSWNGMGEMDYLYGMEFTVPDRSVADNYLKIGFNTSNKDVAGQLDNPNPKSRRRWALNASDIVEVKKSVSRKSKDDGKICHYRVKTEREMGALVDASKRPQWRNFLNWNKDMDPLLGKPIYLTPDQIRLLKKYGSVGSVKTKTGYWCINDFHLVPISDYVKTSKQITNKQTITKTITKTKKHEKHGNKSIKVQGPVVIIGTGAKVKGSGLSCGRKTPAITSGHLGYKTVSC